MRESQTLDAVETYQWFAAGETTSQSGKAIASVCGYCGREAAKTTVFCNFCGGHTKLVVQNKTRLVLFSAILIVAAALTALSFFLRG